MDRKTVLEGTTVWLILVIMGLVFYGYFHNIVMLFRHFSTESLLMDIARIVGIFFAPLGIVMGYN